jgi:hypothetical protein
MTMPDPITRAFPRTVIEDICNQLGYDVDDVERIIITPWHVSVTVGYVVETNAPPIANPWRVRPDPWLEPDDDEGSAS